MLNRYLVLTAFTLIGLLAAAQPETKMTVHEYIDMYKYAAINEMHENGVPASITLSQGIIESANGNSRLARVGNNHFGIKCKRNWDGDTVLIDDDEAQECFRAYPSVWESYKDHSLFLRSNQRYAFLFELDITDYKGWARGLRKAGYATNPRYADILISVIERHELFQYDKLTAEDLKRMMDENNANPPDNNLIPAKPKVEKQSIVYNNIPAVQVDGTESLDTIAVQNDLRPKWVKKWNDLEEGQELQPGDVVYLKPKKRKGTEEFHTVKEGETMWDISQTYAIKLKHLYKKNRMEPGTNPAPGEKLYLQSKRDDTPDTNAPVKKITHTAQQEEPKKTTTYNTTQTKSSDATEHTVKVGETLYSISRKYDVSVDEIKRLNNLTDNSISVGQTLKIRETKKETIQYHYVAKGETLYSISKKYDVSIDQLKEWNNLSANTLSIGQKLIVKK